MNNLLSEFEQQFGGITAEITTKTYLLNNEASQSRPKLSKLEQEIKGLVSDAYELLEHMELEVRDAPQDQREKLRTRVKSYEVELKRLEGEYNRTKISLNPSEDSLRQDLFSNADGGPLMGDEQRQCLLNNSDTLERTSMRLTQSYKSAIESEQIGAQVLSDLQHQRDTLGRARDRLRHTEEDLDQSSRTLNAMMRRAMQNKFIMGAVIVFVVVVVIIVVYVKVS